MFQQYNVFDEISLCLDRKPCRLKDIAQSDKMELGQVTKLNKELSQQISSIGGEREKLQQRLQDALEQVDDLKEQVQSCVRWFPLKLLAEGCYKIFKVVSTKTFVFIGSSM